MEQAEQAAQVQVAQVQVAQVQMVQMQEAVWMCEAQSLQQRPARELLLLLPRLQVQVQKQEQG